MITVSHYFGHSIYLDTLIKMSILERWDRMRLRVEWELKSFVFNYPIIDRLSHVGVRNFLPSTSLPGLMVRERIMASHKTQLYLYNRREAVRFINRYFRPYRDQIIDNPANIFMQLRRNWICFQNENCHR